MSGQIVDPIGQLHIVKASYVWEIMNFTTANSRPGDRIVSSVFSVGQHRWQLWLYPRSDEVDNEDHLALYLKSCNVRAVEAKVEFCIINDRNEKCEQLSTILKVMIAPVDKIGYNRYVRGDVVMNRENGYMQGNKLVILCEITEDTTEYDESTQSLPDILRHPPPINANGH